MKKKLVVPLIMAAMMLLAAAPASASPGATMKTCMQAHMGTDYGTPQEVADMCTNWTPRP